MRHLYRIATIFVIVFLAACESEPPPLPTRFPTATATLEVTATSTWTPTPQPTSTPLPRVQTRAANPEDQSYLQLIHAIPDLSPVTVHVDSMALAFELGPTRYTEPTEIVAGDYTVRVTTHMSGAEDETLLIEQPITVPVGQTLFLILSGAVDSPVLGAYPQTDTPLGAGESSVTLINAIGNGPEAKLQANGSDLSDAVAFTQTSTTATLSSEPTTFSVTTGDEILASHSTELREHFNYTLVALANPGDPATYALLEFSNRVPGFATVRVINAFAGASAIDIYANGALLEESIGYPRTTERRDIPTGFYAIEVFEAGVDRFSSTPLANMELHLNPGDNISFVSMGDMENARLVRFEDDLSPVAPEQARIVFVNTLEYPQRVRVMEGERPVPGVPDLPPQIVSDPVLLDAGTRDFYWRVVEGSDRLGDSVEVAPNVELAAGRSYVFLMTGRSSDAPPIIFSEVVDIDETLALFEEATPQPVSEPTQIRVANALIDKTPLDYLVDGITIATSLPYSQITAPIIVPAGVHTISIRLPEDAFDQAILEYDFLLGGHYTLYAYGPSADLSEILVLRNIVLDDEYPASLVRFVNVTPEDEIRFDFGYTESGRQIAIPTPAEPNDETSVIPFRERLFTGIMKVAVDIGGGEASAPANVQSGQVDFYIVDSIRDLVAAKLEGYALEPGVQYDIIAFQARDSLQVHAQVIPYDIRP